MGHYPKRHVRTTCTRNVCQYITCDMYKLMYTITARSPPVLHTGKGLEGE